jgi:hypothetical protein
MRRHRRLLPLTTAMPLSAVAFSISKVARRTPSDRLSLMLPWKHCGWLSSVDAVSLVTAPKGIILHRHLHRFGDVNNDAVGPASLLLGEADIIDCPFSGARWLPRLLFPEGSHLQGLMPCIIRTRIRGIGRCDCRSGTRPDAHGISVNRLAVEGEASATDWQFRRSRPTGVRRRTGSDGHGNAVLASSLTSIVLVVSPLLHS